MIQTLQFFRKLQEHLFRDIYDEGITTAMEEVNQPLLRVSEATKYNGRLTFFTEIH